MLLKETNDSDDLIIDSLLLFFNVFKFTCCKIKDNILIMKVKQTKSHKKNDVISSEL